MKIPLSCKFQFTKCCIMPSAEKQNLLFQPPKVPVSDDKTACFRDRNWQFCNALASSLLHKRFRAVPQLSWQRDAGMLSSDANNGIIIARQCYFFAKLTV